MRKIIFGIAIGVAGLLAGCAAEVYPDEAPYGYYGGSTAVYVAPGHYHHHHYHARGWEHHHRHF